MKKGLPDWVIMGSQTREFLNWLKNDMASMEQFADWILLKGNWQDCVLIYGMAQGHASDMEMLRRMQLCGIFRKRDHSLYEVSPILYQAVGIPEEFSFPDKESVQVELEKKVSENGRTWMMKYWDQLVLRSGCTREQLIPMISREQIRMTARRYFQMGKQAGDILYLPYFSFETMQGGFSDKLFLQYLNAEKKTIAALTDTWLNTQLPEISMKKIYYGCVKEEMEEMEKSRNGRTGNVENFKFMQVKEKISA